MIDVQRRICERALALFRERGFDRVTIAEIAAASEVGERTVYRYFGTKEGIVLGKAPGTFRGFLDALALVPADATITEAYGRTVRRFLTDPADLDVDRSRMALLRSTPTLRLAWFSELLAFEEGLARWIGARIGRDADDVEVMAAAAAFVAAHRIANEHWDGTGMGGFLGDFDRAMGLLGVRIDDLGRSVE